VLDLLEILDAVLLAPSACILHNVGLTVVKPVQLAELNYLYGHVLIVATANLHG